MSYTSPLGNIPVIDSDSDPLLMLDHASEDGGGFARGYVPRDWRREPFGTFGSGLPWPVIPRSEWSGRIEERERNNWRQVDLCDQAGLTVLNQGSTNYCWINAPVHLIEIMRLVQGQDMVRLSPASAGAIIKNFRNVGGWGTEGLKYLREYGCVPQADWPANAIDRRYDTPQNDALRARYRVTEWVELRPRQFDELATCLLHGYPVAVGYNWWRHEVTAMDLVKTGRDDYGIIINNSWGPSWGERGRGVLTERKATPDDAVAARAVVAS